MVVGLKVYFSNALLLLAVAQMHKTWKEIWKFEICENIGILLIFMQTGF